MTTIIGGREWSLFFPYIIKGPKLSYTRVTGVHARGEACHVQRLVVL